MESSVATQPALEPLAASEDGNWAESPRLAWHVLAALFFAGSTVGILSLLLPHPAVYDEAGIWTNVVLAYATALFAYIVAPRVLPRWCLHVALFGGILAISRAIYLSHDVNGFYTMWYVWVGLYAFFFLGRRAGLVHLALVGIGYGVVLLALDATQEAVARWTMAMTTLAVGGLMVDALADRLRGMASRYATLAGERANLLVALEEIARTDDLTGLPNRRAWDEELTREVARAGREATPLCVAMLDLDRFKNFNDLLGHQAGDRFLKAVTAAWREALRTTDSLARYGGEEFALALPGCDMGDAITLVERMRKAVPDGQTCSAGIACWDGEEGPVSLMGRADAALYEAKAAGRDCIITAVV